MHVAVARYDTSVCDHCRKHIKRGSTMYLLNNNVYCSTAHARAAEHNQQLVERAQTRSERAFERALKRETYRQSRLEAAYRDHM